MIKNARNAEYTKEYNRKMFLRLLRNEPISRSEIARKMGLTRAATSLIADELLKQGLIVETVTTETHRGRTPIPLTLNGDSSYALGVYLNRDGCTIGLVDICGNILKKELLRIDTHHRAEIMDLLIDTAKQMVQLSNIPWSKIIGIGISAPGPLDGESGLIINPPHFDLWHNTNIREALQESLDLPIYLENNASCLANYNLGKPEANGSTDFLLLLVDSGIGSGIISKGKILKGAGYFTSELGHTSINFNGKLCTCGNIGCLETYAAIPALLKGSPFHSWKELIDAYPYDSLAYQLLNAEVEYLSTGVANIANIISFDTILLAGDILYGIDVLAPLLEQKINNRIIRRAIHSIRVLPSCSRADSNVLAAADVAFSRFLTL